MKIQSHNQLIESITKIFENKEKLMQQQDLLNDLQNDIEQVASFLNMDLKFTPLFSVMVCEQLMGEINSLRKIMKNLGFSSLEIIKSHENIKVLKKRGWISISKRKFHSFKTDEFEIAKHVLDAFTYNDKSKLVKQKPETLAEALLQIRQIISYANGDYELEDFISSVMGDLENYLNFDFIASIVNQKSLIDLEKLVLIWMASDVVFGKEEFDFNSLIDFFTQDPSYAFSFKQRISKGRSHLITDGFIEFKRPNYVDFSSVQLGDKTNDLLYELRQNSDQKKQTAKYTVLIEPHDLIEQHLFFNASNEASIHKVDQLLNNENFKKLMDKFLEKGMKDCLTMLFHGSPGTGKTELVKQLARKHERSIYQVDISSIKDMWVGESEKNMKKVFREYADALKYNRRTPILLFNEADALLGLRTNVQHAVDQMNNSLQNILLQELEDMKGIFIATTNLINNIDGAFDRRLLYKLKFELPGPDTRFKILQNQFPFVDKKELKEISENYNLSGGQIQNIKRKLIADQILFGDECNEAETLSAYVKTEISFRTNKDIIGFKKFSA
jgi:AAA+ superfamily predicted ATPase